MGMVENSSNLDLKLEIRRRALAAVGAGAIWVPYCGFGECMVYPVESVRACDIDKDAVAHWRKRWPEAQVQSTTAEKFTKWGSSPYCLADIDHHGMPWLSLKRFLDRAPLQKSIQIVITDGSLQHIQRGKRPFNFQTFRFEQTASLRAAEQLEHWPGDAATWLGAFGSVKVIEKHRINTVGYARLQLELNDSRYSPAHVHKEEHEYITAMRELQWPAR